MVNKINKMLSSVNCAGNARTMLPASIYFLSVMCITSLIDLCNSFQDKKFTCRDIAAIKWSTLHIEGCQTTSLARQFSPFR